MHERQGNKGAPLSIFISYAHKDEPLRQQLEAHLSLLRRQGLVADWHDRQIIPGANWAQEIDEHLERAAIILLLVSSDFLASDYCYETEMQHALARHQRGEARILPIILRPCDWTAAPFAHLQALPHEGKAVTSWTNQDEAFLEIAQGLRQVIEQRPIRPSSTLEQQNRTRFLEKVSLRSKDLLDQSLRGTTPIALRLRTQPAAVLNAMRLRLRQGAGPEQDVPADMTLVQIYDQVGGELLLLGAPGAGKTTLLLELACALQRRAQQEREYPLAVIVNLSTWANGRQPLEVWLVEEIVRSYEVPRHAIAQLVQQDQILPLLDGLDEVPEQARAACIDAINHFQHTHWLSLVVCSRQQEYSAQSRRLTLRSALLLQPLTENQVDTYFKAVGKPLAGIRWMLRRNAELRELVRTPLMLQLVTLAYHGVSVRSLPQEGSFEEQRRLIFDQYVQRRLQDQEAAAPRSTQHTLHWLTFLARQMRTHNQTVFYLEHLQPDWLPAGRERQWYERLVVRGPGIIVGVLLSLLVITLFFSFPSSRVDVWFVPLGGLIGGMISGSDLASFRLKGMIPVWKQRWRSLGLLGVGIGVLVGGLVATGFALGYQTSLRDWLIYGSSAGFCALLLTVTIASAKVVAHLSAVPALHRSWWHRFIPHGLQPSHLHLGAMVGLLSGLLIGLSVGLSLGLSLGLSAGLSDGLSFGIIGIFLSLLLLGRSSDIELAEIVAWPGKRLWQSFTSKHHLSTSVRLLLLIFLFFVLSFGLNDGLSLGLSDGLRYLLSSGLSRALGFGLSLGMAYWILSCLWAAVSRETLDDHLRTKPNQGIKRSVRSALLAGLLASGICFLVGLLNDILFFGLSDGLSDGLSLGLSHGLSDGIVIGGAGALLAALFIGGLASLRHLLLRVRLRQLGVMPWQYVGFLDDAARHVFLYKDGGGYRFIHRLFLDYFASLEKEEPSCK